MTLVAAPVLPSANESVVELDSAGRIASLDGVRGLAIGLVMVLHMTMLPPSGNPLDRFWQNFWNIGWCGVSLFFVLSGFLITGILLDCKQQPHYFRNFYARRMLRIFPLYYAVLVLSLVILPRLEHPATGGLVDPAPGEAWWYWLYLSNVLFAMHDGYRHGMLNPSWSLAIEEQFYLVWPVVVLLLSRRRLMWVCGGLILTALVTRCAMVASGAGVVRTYVLTTSHLDALAMGALLALAARSRAGLSRFIRPARVLVVMGAAALVLSAAAGVSLTNESARMCSVGFTLMALWSGGLIVLALSTPGWSGAFAHPLLRMLGKYSYALYLFNLPLRAVIRDQVYGPRQFHTLMGSALPGQFVFYVICFALTLALAWLSWNLFEKHFLGLKRFFGPRHAAAA